VNTYVELEESQFTNQPFMSTFDIDTSNWTVGLRYRLKIGVENHVDERVSDSVEFLLASVPD
jgi:hypothetical protein